MDGMDEMDMGYDMTDMMATTMTWTWADGHGHGHGHDANANDDARQQRFQENPQPPEVIASRQQLNYVLQQIHLGVTGQPTAGLAELETLVESWLR